MTTPAQAREAEARDVLPTADWQWLADQLRAWPEKRVHPERTMCDGVLRPMAADVIEAALTFAAQQSQPVGEGALLPNGTTIADALEACARLRAAPQTNAVTVNIRVPKDDLFTLINSFERLAARAEKTA